MKKCGKKHIENRSGIACCGADYPFGPSGSFRDIVSVPELRPACRTSGKRPSVSHALCCPHVVRPFADSPWGAFCCRSCAPNVREASRRIPCAVLSACRPAVCRFAVGCLLLSFLRAERPGSVPPYPMRCAVRMSSGRLPIRRGVPFAAVLARRTFGKRLAVSHALCCPHVVRPFADSPWGAFCCRSCAPNVREASLRLPCAVLPACRLRDVPPYAAPSFGSVLGAVLSRTAVNQKCSKPSKRRRCRSPRSSQTGPDCPSCEGVMRPTG